jgi:tRNA (guanine-N7-)-methyltransferase
VVRQHVNPLSSQHQQPRQLPDLRQLFTDPQQPLHLDIGSARGRFLLAMAPEHPEWNFLGVEIRRGLVDAAERDRLRHGLANLRFLFCNANVSLEEWLGALPAGQLQRVTIQFPDPWFKRKHQKRRVLQPPLLAAIAAALAPGAEFFLQSDVPEVIEPMVTLTEASGAFERPATDPRPWRPTNPLPVCTERERQVIERGAPVYRVLFCRNGSAHNPAIAIRP